jgi:hypothetical protein
MSAAWKLRAALYSMLAAVALLVLTQRPSASGGDLKTDRYAGLTGQGTRLTIDLARRRFHSLNASGIWADCKGRPRVGVTWSPVADQANVTYSQHGSEFTVHEWPHPAFPHPPGARVNLYMRANVNWDVHRIDGEITYIETGTRGNCSSGPIRFGVSR